MITSSLKPTCVQAMTSVLVTGSPPGDVRAYVWLLWFASRASALSPGTRGLDPCVMRGAIAALDPGWVWHPIRLTPSTQDAAPATTIFTIGAFLEGQHITAHSCALDYT